MKNSFRIELLPALHGDSLWIEYGKSTAPSRIVIDGGPIGAYAALDARVGKLKPGDREIELLVITHIDADHIEGAVRLIAAHRADLSFREVWFNGWRHLETKPGLLGAVQGEFLSALISRYVGEPRWNCSAPFAGGPLVVATDTPPVATLAGGMRLTLLSPTPKKLEKLQKQWKKDVAKAGFAPGDLDKALERLKEQTRLVPKGLLGGSYQEGKPGKIDNSVANGSSIAFLAEYADKRCLCLGDAHPDALIESLGKLGATKAKPLAVDAIKLPHHGSASNYSPALYDLVSCRRFLVSSNGDQFNHPDAAVIDALIARGIPKLELHFNYLTDTTRPWSNKKDQTKRRFKALYPKAEAGGITVTL